MIAIQESVQSSSFGCSELAAIHTVDGLGPDVKNESDSPQRPQ